MSYTITWLNVLGLAAGILILAVGAFVLYARPRGTINRAFFGLAVLDGLSGILFYFWLMANEPGLQVLFNATYYPLFIAFPGYLLAFGLLFPVALGGEEWKKRISGSVLAATLGTIALHALKPDWFWDIVPRGQGVMIQDTTGGQLVIAFFWISTAAVIMKLAWGLLNTNHPKEKRMTGLFLAGMSVGYATSFLAGLVFAMMDSSTRFLDIQEFGLFVLHLAGVLATASFLFVVIWLFRRRAALSSRTHRTFLFTVFAIAILVPARLFSEDGFYMSQILGLVAYPLILAYAIVTQEAFDINPQVRNAAAVGAAGALFAAGFVIGEDFLQDILAAGFLGEVASPVAVQAISAVLAAAINLPIFLGARRLAQRAFSGALVDPKHLGNLATYRLVLEGALEDGILGARESKALKTLRAELGISQREHEEITAQVHASFQDRHAGADDPAHTGDPAEGA